jgi:hypothetical protein
VVILLDAGAEPMGDIVTPLVRALDDPTVAVAGPWGLVSDDQRHFDPVDAAAAASGADVAAIDLACLAFRRADYLVRGPLDERFATADLLDAWWSLVLRDGGDDGSEARRAVVVPVPLVRHGARTEDAAAERRNRYRLLDRFGNRSDLAVRAD